MDFSIAVTFEGQVYGFGDNSSGRFVGYYCISLMIIVAMQVNWALVSLAEITFPPHSQFVSKRVILWLWLKLPQVVDLRWPELKTEAFTPGAKIH